jgi:hypothetical protein
MVIVNSQVGQHRLPKLSNVWIDDRLLAIDNCFQSKIINPMLPL